MGLLDSLIGAAEQAMGQSQGGGQGGADLAGLIGGLLNNGAVQGGLAGLLQQLQAGGLAEHVQSWVSQGANQPVSADQITAALGGAGGVLGQLAQHLGQSHADTAGLLAQALPELVNHLTPNGQLPSGDVLTQMLGQFMGGASPAR
ncbi:MAG: DUF937 domain-containing protein [Paucibacter sp.]|nr:DUF937 domain-containing protein [Roseateles sp.]